MPSAPATTASTTSLTVPPSEFLIALNCPRSASTHVNRRWGPIRTLNGVGGAAWSPVQASAPTLPSARPARSGHGPRAAQRRPDPSHHLGRHGRALEQRVGQQLGAARERARDPLVVGRRHRQRIGRGVEQHGRDVDAGDPVDERVMGLRQHREAPVGEALDEPQLPQRPAAVERLGEHAARQPLQLAVAAGARQRRVADVVADLEMGIVHPHRAALAERHERQPLPVAGHEVESRLDRLDQLVVRRGACRRTPSSPPRACGPSRARDAEMSCRARSACPCSPPLGW